jgi:subtilisin-like proprotein convertase family protein
MRRRLKYINAFSGLLILIACGLIACDLIISPYVRTASAQRNGAQLSDAAQRQIKSLLDEKNSRSPAQKKIDSRLLYTMKARRGEAMTRGGEVRSLRSAVEIAKEISKPDPQERTLVDITAAPGGAPVKELIQTIARLGGEVDYANMQVGAVRARIPFKDMEELAGSPVVRSVRPPAIPKHQRQIEQRDRLIGAQPVPLRRSPALQAGLRPDFQQRALNLRTHLSSALTGNALTRLQAPLANVGIVTSEGDLAERVVDGRNFFGVTGAGVKIGILSSGVADLAQSIASGELPPDVTVLPGQAGIVDGEGTAMLEIVHDLAPGAKLYFATAFNGLQSFADNIRALRAAGCDVICDDIIYNVESPFHDDVISTAVEEVVADGALYFSSAGNDGNFDDGTSSCWEGDFKNSRTTLPSHPDGTLHDFGDGVISNRAESSSTFILGLWWSDPLGASDNDYDFFIMDNALTTVLDASTNVQDGDDDPFEFTTPGAQGNERIIIFKADAAKERALHLNNFGGQLGIATSGSTHGHNSVAGAFGVAAINVALANGGPFIGGPTNPVELFSSDGYRRVFYKSDGSPITPGNILFSSNGGEVRKKPELTAADGVSTSVPGFTTFFGTSAAAPEAAAIAALLKSAKPQATLTRIQNALTMTALDIEALGIDRDSGAGIVDAFAALQFIGAAPAPFLESGAAVATPAGGDGDGFIEPGESGTLTATLVNVGGATAVGVSATLTTTSPGVTITSATSGYPIIGSNGQSAANTAPFAFTLDHSASCGQGIDFRLTVNYANSNVGTQAFSFRVLTAPPDAPAAAATVSYTGPPVTIPNNVTGTFTIPIAVTGVSGALADLNFSFGGTSCTTDAGATTVGFDHTWIGDLIIRLTSPQGTTVTLINQAGGPNNIGHNFCNTVLDDSATASIQTVLPTDAPFTGSFKPANPLSAFKGENVNGTWTLSVADVFPTDGGNVRAFSLAFSTYVCNGP